MLVGVLIFLGFMGPLTESKAPWYQIGFSGGGLGVFSKAHISFQRVTGLKDNKLDPNVPAHWEAEMFTESTDMSGKITKTRKRADGRSCPAVADGLAALAAVPALHPTPVTGLTDQWIPTINPDGAAFFLNRYGSMVGSNQLFSESFGDASARFLPPIWERVSTALRSCWIDVPEGSL